MVTRAWRALRESGLPHLLDAVPGQDAILLGFDAVGLARAPENEAGALGEAVVRAVDRVLHAPDEPCVSDPTGLLEVPFCTCPACAMDLSEVASQTGMSEQQVVDLFRGQPYVVRFIGFSPGFSYLAGLPDSLNVPRLDQPRPSVPAGSVAIASGQAGIYPSATPGGWRLIGRTPIRLFEPSSATPCRLGPGDRVRFVPIDHERFDRVSRETT